jgi:hypothetical protein
LSTEFKIEAIFSVVERLKTEAVLLETPADSEGALISGWEREVTPTGIS